MTHVTHPNIRRIINKVFSEIGVDDVDKFHTYGCSTVARSRGMHQVMIYFKCFMFQILFKTTRWLYIKYFTLQCLAIANLC
jgi:hypothetical protein